MARGSWTEDNTLNKYCEKEARLNRVLLFDGQDIDWYFEESELKNIQRMWRQELHVNYMADFLNRKEPDEIVLAVMHLARENKLHKRKYGLLEGVYGPYAKEDRLKRAKPKR